MEGRRKGSGEVEAEAEAEAVVSEGEDVSDSEGLDVEVGESVEEDTSAVDVTVGFALTGRST